MHKRKVAVLGLCIIIAVASVACGSDKTDVAGNETDVVHEAEQGNETEEIQDEQEVVSENDDEKIVDEEKGETEVEKDIEAEVESEEETADKRYRIGDAELEEIVAKYDKVFSDSRVKAYFGYNVPAGWKWPEYYTWDDPDGREEKRSVDHWINENNSAETIEINSFYSGSIDNAGRIAYDSEGNEWEIQSDETEYNNRYNDALHLFCKTGEWEEPERASCPDSSLIKYCTDRIPRGEIDTPYGKGILYSAVYEMVFYTGYDDEKHYYTTIDDSEHFWSAGEGMILEIDNYFIQIEYSLSDWVDFNGYPEDFINAEYTGRLDEIIPQMFETK